MRRLLLATALCLSGCAPKVIPAPAVTSPKFPEFVRPDVPAGMANSAAAINQSRGWTFLQSGDLRTAEHEFAAALHNAPAFYPAEIALGYVELARKDAKAALPHFEHALEQQADLSAFVGRGQALLALSRDGDALAAFESALGIDPNQTEIRRRVDILKFRVIEQSIARARESARAGRLDQAVQAYTTAIASSPDSPFLYRELAAIERQRGNTDAALEHFRRAVALDASDAKSIEQIGDILESRGEFDEAAKAYTESLAVEANADVEKKIEDLRGRAALAKLPAEYRAIAEATQITRADLAALIGIRLAPLLRSGQSGDAALITDVRASWAVTWIVAVARAGVMEPFANHAFQPRTIVRRTDLAQAVARLLSRVSSERRGSRQWESARLKFSDLAPTHLAYPAASVAVASGAMKAGPDTSFQPSRAVTGAEAIDAVAMIQTLAGLK
jgi:tetratricopeptide (TPR) repeat protein